VDPSNWWVFSEGWVYTTNDAGYSWQHVQASGIPSGWNLQDAQAIDGTHAWSSLVSTSHPERQSLAVTADSGAHWALVSTPLP
jgi:hypothetical protein